ncbi:MAG: sugar ABC transporter ATP-binding protein [Cellulomonas sp.]
MTDDVALLKVTGIAKAYGPAVALRSVDLTVHRGEMHALLGANGAGKSTLVKILAGVVRADAGSISVKGEEVSLLKPADSRARGIAAVFQDPALIPDLTLADNLRLTEVDPTALTEWIDKLGIARPDLRRLVRDIPLPILRMYDLARALSLEPSLLLLDEITATLPADLATAVLHLVNDWRHDGHAVVFISHRLREVLAHCDQATVLRDGTDVAHFVPTDGGEQRMVQAMLGETASLATSTERGRSELSDAQTVLEVRNLAAGRMLRDVSFSVRKGEILGVAALEGQGQDELFAALAGDIRPTGGEILVDGKPMRARSPHDAIKRGLALIPSDRQDGLLPKRSVSENIAAPGFSQVRQWGPINLPREKSVVAAAVNRLSIDTRAQSEARRLSGGNQQKLTIARWLATGFQTLLCFDPTRGIDVGTKTQIYELMRGLASEGKTIVVYFSELREIPLVCDRVVVIYNGTIIHEQSAIDADEVGLLSVAHGIAAPEVTA